jgi:hypothetical protein
MTASLVWQFVNIHRAGRERVPKGGSKVDERISKSCHFDTLRLSRAAAPLAGEVLRARGARKPQSRGAISPHLM